MIQAGLITMLKKAQSAIIFTESFQQRLSIIKKIARGFGLIKKL